MKIKQGKILKIGIAVLVLAGFIWGFGLQQETVAKAPTPVNAKVQMVPMNFAALAQEAKPGVVNIRTVKTMKGGGPVFKHFFGNPFGPQNPRGKKDPFHEFFGPFSGRGPSRDFKQRSLGSGFIISKDGYIVTNNHVIDNADEIKVKLADGKEYDAELVGRDPNTDLALIKIKGSSSLVPLKMGDSDTLDVGSWVVAIGSPFGLEQTVTAGIVSAKGRTIGSGPYDDFIQTDASINPGNSGGPLLNMEGEVVGINTAIVAQGQGIGFAIPINLAKGIISQLKSGGEVTRGWLGVAIQDLSQEMAEYYGIDREKGVFVADVFKGDPADEAGIQPKDIIIEVDGKSIETSHQLTGMIADLHVGATAAVTVLRNGKEKTFKVKLGKRDDEKRASRKPEQEQAEELGIRVSDMTPELARRFNISETAGVIVMGVDADSKAAESDVRTGDIIKEINHQEIENVEGYRKALSEIKPGEPVNLFIWRKNMGFLVIKMTK